MNGRVNGIVYRGNALYYTFQRLSTGLSFLDRLENKKGKDLKEFRVVFTKEGEEQKELSALKFRSWASGLKSLDPVAPKSKVKTVTGRGAKTKLSKKTAGKGKRTQQPAEQSAEDVA